MTGVKADPATLKQWREDWRNLSEEEKKSYQESAKNHRSRLVQDLDEEEKKRKITQIWRSIEKQVKH